eukprot:UN07872
MILHSFTLILTDDVTQKSSSSKPWWDTTTLQNPLLANIPTVDEDDINDTNALSIVIDNENELDNHNNTSSITTNTNNTTSDARELEYYRTIRLSTLPYGELQRFLIKMLKQHFSTTTEITLNIELSSSTFLIIILYHLYFPNKQTNK